ncbi:hypothetical protein TNIN_218641 [Trichonephila inaurata madagascariensis]|uniref:Uncharacterized protein n=1 Tax=Trichonephila inaurata madagascariensis TaxID=2747483 RepID=A0A8X6YMH2_9ARAC|nr:hypothetical protein TNIN_218641 [Trichonephila inaurata madagascariensis]
METRPSVQITKDLKPSRFVYHQNFVHKYYFTPNVYPHIWIASISAESLMLGFEPQQSRPSVGTTSALCPVIVKFNIFCKF